MIVLGNGGKLMTNDCRRCVTVFYFLFLWRANVRHIRRNVQLSSCRSGGHMDRIVVCFLRECFSRCSGFPPLPKPASPTSNSVWIGGPSENPAMVDGAFLSIWNKVICLLDVSSVYKLRAFCRVQWLFRSVLLLLSGLQTERKHLAMVTLVVAWILCSSRSHVVRDDYG